MEGNVVDPARVDYQLRDRLGSTIAIADRWGHFNGAGTSSALTTVEGELRRFFDPFGAPSYANFAGTAARPELKLAPSTLRGFTGHEHLDGARLIHMNGRMFDYRSGRFLSVDPFIQAPANSQSLNPYSYVFNNPLSGTDPSGYAACVSDPEKECSDLGPARQAFTSQIQGISIIGGGPDGNGHVKDPLEPSRKEMAHSYLKHAAGIGSIADRGIAFQSASGNDDAPSGAVTIPEYCESVPEACADRRNIEKGVNGVQKSIEKGVAVGDAVATTAVKEVAIPSTTHRVVQ